ncbi:hypothetical protein DXG03_003272 [Asterophora parasitica]|uniref:Uncharacterized protein n=1 Tax=Asterophora parasitica TaxID=117018 RepID=A0A9P7GAZ3_9AGAR|nr:hypothetical protein DXG03_003272 [Asterophora parasitica]
MYNVFKNLFSVFNSLVPVVDHIYDTTSPLLTSSFTYEVDLTSCQYSALLSSVAVIAVIHLTLSHPDRLHPTSRNTSSHNPYSFLELPGLPLVDEEKAPTSSAYVSRLVRGRVQCPLPPAPVSSSDYIPVYFTPVEIVSAPQAWEEDSQDSPSAIRQLWTTQMFVDILATTFAAPTPDSPLLARIAFGECSFFAMVNDEIIQPLVEKVHPVVVRFSAPLVPFVNSLRARVVSLKPVFANRRLVPLKYRVETTRKCFETHTTRVCHCLSLLFAYLEPATCRLKVLLAYRNFLERLRDLQARNPLSTCDSCPTATQWRRFAINFAFVALLLYEGIAWILRLRHAHRAAAAADNERERIALTTRNRRQRRKAEQAARSVPAPKSTYHERLAKERAILREFNSPAVAAGNGEELGVPATEALVGLARRWWLKGARR